MNGYLTNSGFVNGQKMLFVSEEEYNEYLEVVNEQRDIQKASDGAGRE